MEFEIQVSPEVEALLKAYRSEINKLESQRLVCVAVRRAILEQLDVRGNVTRLLFGDNVIAEVKTPVRLELKDDSPWA